MRRRKITGSRPLGIPGLELHTDPDAVRAQHIKAYRAQLRSLNKANEKMQQFVDVDQPAFSQWWQQEFAEELLRQMQLEKKLFDLELRMDAIEQYRTHYQVTYSEASEVVTKAQALGNEAVGELMRVIFAEIDASRAKRTKKSQEKPKTETENRGSEQEDDRGESMFDDFLDEADRRTSSHSHKTRSESPQEDTAELYIKRIYRDLVRLLHPDAKGGREQSAEDKVLWFELQKAYEWHDIEKMEAIFKAVHGKGAVALDFKTIPIGDILAMKEGLTKNLKGVNQDVRMAKQGPNWDFKGRSKRKGFLKDLRYSFREEIDQETVMLEFRIATVEKQLRLWTGERQTKGKKRR